MTQPTVVVVDYDAEWPRLFDELRARVWPAVADVALAIEHVGSTSVVGLAAKPIIDMTVVVASPADVPATIERLAAVGYRHVGDLGIAGREAFKAPDGLPRHNLYICAQGTIGIVNQIAVRDYLRAHPEAAAAYAQLKKQLSRRFPNDINSYVLGKTELLLGVLRAAGLTEAQLAEIEEDNRP
ncbi:MAG TPA: GrpB family protein [Vicinamibacterales bacterium]|nr:GrpB family protein [Vicinamibacterales bacterium]